MRDEDVADALGVIRERRPTGELAALPPPAYIPAERPFEDGTRGGGGSVIFLPDVNDYAGGAETDLDGQTTVGAQTGVLYIFQHVTDNLCFFKLREGDDAEELPRIVRPLDFDAADNAVVFENILSTLTVFQGVKGIIKRVRIPGTVEA